MLGCFEEGWLRFIRKGRVFYRTDQFNAAWNRVNDDISTGTFVLPATPDCCPADVHARCDYVEFERNGVVEWLGYSMRPIVQDGIMTVEAVDLLDGFQRRIIRDPIEVVGADLSDIAIAAITSANSIDPIPVVPVMTPTGILADRIITTAEYRIAWDLFKNDLLQVGLDMTMVGALLYMGPLEDRGLKPLVINELMIAGVPNSGEDGSSYANRIIAKGQNGLVSIYPPGPPVAPAPYPLIEVVVDANDAEDQNTLDVIAKQHYDLRSAVPRFLSMDQGVTLREDSPWALSEYIPGRLAEVRLDQECFGFEQAMRLQSLNYTLTTGKEEVKVATVPVGTVSAGVLQ